MINNSYEVPLKKIEFGKVILNEKSKKYIIESVENSWITGGPRVKQFEEQWGELFKYKHNIALSSGTDACLNACLALYGLGANPGDEVIVPALSFIATSNAVRAANLKPVFVDIDPQTLNIDPSLIEDAITDKTVAIMCVHTMGKPCEMDIIKDISNSHKLTLIEDCCEAHGAKFRGTFVGHWGDMALFSFYAAHLICCGEGGMLSTNRKDISDIVNSTKSHGRSGIYFDHPLFGLNSKMNDMEASIGLGQIDDFWPVFEKRRSNFSFLDEKLNEFRDDLILQEENYWDTHCPHGISITFKKEKQKKVVCNFLDGSDIHWKRNFGCIPTQHGAFSYLGHKLGDFPNAEMVGNNGIHVGVHQHLTDQELTYLGACLQEGIKEALCV